MTTASRPSLAELLKDTPRDKLEAPCSDKDLCTLALDISNWKELASFLNLNPTDEEEIEEEYRSTKRRRVEVLMKWREEYRSRATYEKLSEALWKIGRSDLVERVCHLLTKELESSSEEEADSDCVDTTSGRIHLSRLQLKLPCQDKHLCRLAQLVPDWKELAPYLKLTKVDEKVIEEEHSHGLERRIVALRKWHQLYKNKATIGKLWRALKKIRMLDLADKFLQICTTLDSDEEDEEPPLPKRQKLFHDNSSLLPTENKLPTAVTPYPADCSYPPDTDCMNKTHIPTSVSLIMFIPPQHYEEVEKMFHQLALGGHSHRINEKANKLVKSKSMSPSIKVLALGFQALEYIHGAGDTATALDLLEQAMKIIKTSDEMESNNSIILKARIHRHFTIAFRKMRKLDKALDHIMRAKDLYQTARPPPYDSANLLCERAAILETMYKDNMDEHREEIRKMWKSGAEEIVRAKNYQFPTVVFVICARQAMFHMKAWDGKPQSELLQPSNEDLTRAEDSLLQCAEIKASQYHPSVYKVSYNLAFSYVRFWQGNITEAIAYTESAISHYDDCQRKNRSTETKMYERLQWLQSHVSDQTSPSENDVLVEVLH